MGVNRNWFGLHVFDNFMEMLLLYCQECLFIADYNPLHHVRVYKYVFLLKDVAVVGSEFIRSADTILSIGPKCQIDSKYIWYLRRCTATENGRIRYPRHVHFAVNSHLTK